MNGRSGFTLSVTFAELITSSVTKDEHEDPEAKAQKKFLLAYRTTLASYCELPWRTMNNLERRNLKIDCEMSVRCPILS
jgi:hypothetical protein